MPKARPQYRILYIRQDGPISFAAPICGWSAGPLGIGSARRSASCLPIYSYKAVTVSVRTGLWTIPLLQHCTTWLNSNLASGDNDDMLEPPRQKPYPMPGLPATLGDRLMEQVAGRFGFEVRVLPRA